MARDSKKYLYLTIGILRGSKTHELLLEDAEELNTRMLPTIAGIRLIEYYKLREAGLLNSLACDTTQSTNKPMNQQAIETSSSDLDIQEALGHLAGAASYWPKDDDNDE